MTYDQYTTYLSSSKSSHNGPRAQNASFIPSESGSFKATVYNVNPSATWSTGSSSPSYSHCLSNLGSPTTPSTVTTQSANFFRSKQLWSSGSYLDTGSIMFDKSIATLPEYNDGVQPTDRIASIEIYSASYFYETKYTGSGAPTESFYVIHAHIAMQVSRSATDNKTYTFRNICHNSNVSASQSSQYWIGISSPTSVSIMEETTFSTYAGYSELYPYNLQVFTGSAFIRCSPKPMVDKGLDTFAFGLFMVATGSINYPQWVAFDLNSIVALTGSQTASLPGI